MILEPLTQMEVEAADSDELEELALAYPGHEIWKRETTYLALPKPNWLRLYQAKFGPRWEAMFLPNGQGTFEWHLGWTMDIPDGYSVLVMQHDLGSITIPTGVLRAAVIRRLNEARGQSIAVAPARTTTIRRGDPIARIVLLHPSSLEYPIESSRAGRAGPA